MKFKRIIRILLVIIITFCACFEIYVRDCYNAEKGSIQVLDETQENVEIIKKEHQLIFLPDKPIAGFIFYPGGKVEYEAYTLLMMELAKHNVLCIIMEMPFNLAVLDINVADDVYKENDIDNWYIGGHSLGGSMAATYIEDHLDEFNGLILLASYSATDLSSTNLNILSIYGSEDQVLNKEKYKKNRIFLESNFKEVIIKGGNHSGFGDYGHQEGDGVATITNEKQIEITSKEIVKMIRGSVH